MLKSVVLIVARIAVGVIFLIAGVDKLSAVGAFADAIRAFHILPAGLILPFAIIVPCLELLVAAYLLVGFQARFGAALSILLLAIFIGALGNALVTGNTHHACGCFGPAAKANPILAFLVGGSSITPWDVIRDLILIALSIPILIAGAGPLSLDHLIARRFTLSTSDSTLKDIAS